MHRINKGVELIEKAKEAEYYPLSYSQKRLWALQNLDEKSFAYNTPNNYILIGNLNIDAFKDIKMRVAINELKAKNPAKIVIAVPVAPSDVAEQLRQEVDELIVLQSIPLGYFGAVGAYYEKFDQVTDEEVMQLLKET